MYTSEEDAMDIMIDKKLITYDKIAEYACKNKKNIGKSHIKSYLVNK